MASYMETWNRIFGAKRIRRIFVAATRQNVGKTTICLGLIAALAERFKEIGFIKPVGQRYLIEDGYKVDEDSVLMERIFNFKFPLQDMSPVAVDRGYTRKFLNGEGAPDAEKNIKEAFNRVAEGKKIVVIEGTGHAGVGSVFDLSNATVAKMLNSKVVLVSSGGIGKPIDEIMLNKALFDKKGVRFAGVIVNKVMPNKYDKINKYVRVGLGRLGVGVFGVVPYVEMLDTPIMQNYKEEMDMHVLCGEESLTRPAKKILVGAMEVREAAQYLEDDCLVITPGDRTDILNLLIRVHQGRSIKHKRIAGIILSGGLTPKRRIYSALKKTGIPTLMSRFDTYDVASRVHDLTVKIKSRDEKKVKMAIDTVNKYVDIEQALKSIG